MGYNNIIDVDSLDYVLFGSKDSLDIFKFQKLYGLSNLDCIVEKLDMNQSLSIEKATGTDVILDNYIYQDFIIARIIYEMDKYFIYLLAQNKQLFLFLSIENKLAKILIQIENIGIKIDVHYLKELEIIFKKKLQKVEQEIFQISNYEFNIASVKQLSKVLFDDLGLKPGKKSKKTGNFATSSEVLEVLSANGATIASKVLIWRFYNKLLSTYITGLLTLVNKDNSRIHSSFNNNLTLTGRLSSSKPNLQNIPIAKEEASYIRQAFIAKNKDYKLISADYSQIELRILAHIADISLLQNAFKNNIDIHSLTASQIFQIDITEVTTAMRRRS